MAEDPLRGAMLAELGDLHVSGQWAIRRLEAKLVHEDHDCKARVVSGDFGSETDSNMVLRFEPYYFLQESWSLRR
jgi:hypothetical protein